MATARIAATAVHRAAEAKIAEQKKAEADAIVARLDELEREPVTTGALWWKRTHYRTRAEADAELDRSGRFFIRQIHLQRIGRAAKLRDLAKAALSGCHSGIGTGKGDGFVTLDADDVRFLGLEAIR